MPIAKTEEEVAYHEAGHIVAALILGNIHIDFASIISRKNEAGRVRPFVAEYNDGKKNTTRQMIILTLSGPVAHKRYYPDMDPRCGEGDFQQVNKYFHELCIPESEYEEHLNKFRKKTERLINKHWDLIVKIAEALVEKKEIGSDEIYKVYHKYFGLDKILKKKIH
jgi:ATP-dependent Zn protease